jgi:methylmalonyl-CoA/ethylmalonyl-CoA epimerase
VSSPDAGDAVDVGNAEGHAAGDPSVLMDIDHVGIAVADLDAAVEEYRAALGAEPLHREVVPDQGVEEVLFRAGTSYIQLLGALGPRTPVGRFLEKRGEGVHHVGYRVADVAAVLDRLRAADVPLLDEAPRPGSRGTTVAFVHPRGFRGVLVELVQEAPPTGPV